eukprot:4781854-Prymnesium_polylepis.1
MCYGEWGDWSVGRGEYPSARAKTCLILRQLDVKRRSAAERRRSSGHSRRARDDEKSAAKIVRKSGDIPGMDVRWAT